MRLVQRAPVQNSRQIYSEFSLLVLPREESTICCEIHNGAEGIRKLFLPSSTSTTQGERGGHSSGSIVSERYREPLITCLLMTLSVICHGSQEGDRGRWYSDGDCTNTDQSMHSTGA